MKLPDEAIAAYQKAVASDPDYPDVRGAMATVYATQGKWTEAAAQWKEEIKRDPLSPRWHGALAETYLRAGELDKARASFEDTVRLAADDPAERAFGQCGLGDVYREQGRWQEALDAYEAAAKLAPKYPDTLYGLGVVYLHLGRQEEARKQEAALREVDPGQAEELAKLLKP
jgi:tetratricopeptide (TPR) repeat protein